MQEKSLSQRLSEYLGTYTDGHVLGLVRFMYGILMVYEMIDYLRIGLVHNMFFAPLVNFKYDGLRWVTQLPEPIMNGIVWALLGLAVMMTLGIWFKWAARLFALGYAYIFLIDTSLYNNHIYLFILLALLLSFTHADHFFSWRKHTVEKIQRWEPFLIQFQLIIVYVYAALVKIKYDWMIRQEPVRSMCNAIGPDHWLHPLVKNEPFVYMVNYGGFLLDLLTPILLWYKPARKIGIPLLVLFHLSNSQLFNDIGIFPFVMLAALIIFFDTEDVPLLRQWVRQKKVPGAWAAPQWDWSSSLLRKGVTVYFIFQLLFPWRGFFLPNDMDWTTIGNRFAWRVKANNRVTREMKFELLGANGQTAPVDLLTFINTHQMNTLVSDPRAIRDLAQGVERIAKARGYTILGVKASIGVAYNGKPVQHFVVPTVDLTKVSYSPFKKLNWIAEEMSSF